MIESKRLVALCVLVLAVVVLAGTAATVLRSSATRSALNPGSHGFTEMFFAFAFAFAFASASVANGNGSAFGGLNANTLAKALDVVGDRRTC
ncbi:MAG: potassium-transporting ATPase subunit KdpA [Acidimicrobiales bacterium]